MLHVFFLLLICIANQIFTYQSQASSCTKNTIEALVAGDVHFAEKYFIDNQTPQEVKKAILERLQQAKIDAHQSSYTLQEKCYMGAGVVSSLIGFACLWSALDYYSSREEWNDNGWQEDLNGVKAVSSTILGIEFVAGGGILLVIGGLKIPSKWFYQKMLAIAKLQDDAQKRRHK